MFSSRVVRQYDFVLLGAALLICILGLVTLYSVDKTFFYRQLIFVPAAILLMTFGSRIHFSWLRAQPWFRYGFYLLALLLLTIANLQAATIRGTRGWIALGDYQFEPAELSKVALILVLAHFFSRRYVEAWFSRNLLLSLLFSSVPAGLIALHPDFGSAAVIGALWVGFLLFSGIHVKRFFVGLLAFLVFLIVLWTSFLRPYQKDRVIGFFVPTFDPLGVNYNVIQSKIAIGSAGFFGKGFQAGTQTQLHFLPEAHTDFIFAAFVEEWGILGGIMLIGLFLLMLYRITLAGIRAGSNEVKFIALGTSIVFLIQFFINAGSNLGIVPVTGITLPFFSYGGSSILTSALLLAIIQSANVDSSRS